MKTDSVSIRSVRLLCFILAMGLLSWSTSMNAQSSAAASPPPGSILYSMAHPEWPPLPGNPLNLPAYWVSNNIYGAVYALDDRDVNYDELAADAENNLNRALSESGGFSLDSFGPTDFWIEINAVSNNAAWLTLHGTTNDGAITYVVQSAADLLNPDWQTEWAGAGSDGQTVLPGLPLHGLPKRFYRGAISPTLVSVFRGDDAVEFNPTNSDGHDGWFNIQVSSLAPIPDLNVYYRMSGSALNGVDYTNLSGTVTIPQGQGAVNVYVHPLDDTEVEFEETVTLTLLNLGNYLVYPPGSATITLSDNFGTNVFVPVVTNAGFPIGIDYHPVSNALAVSVNYISDGYPRNFILVNSNGLVATNWTGVAGAPGEVKLATVKSPTAGFTNGDVYFGGDTSIGWLSADGSKSNLTWCTLTNGVATNVLSLRGGLHVDQTGVFSNDLIAVTSDAGASFELKGVWRIDSGQHPFLLAEINTPHLEGVTTLTNDVAEWGPWAGKIITGDEDEQVIYTIDDGGGVTPYGTESLIVGGIDPEDFDIIPPNQDLYACDPIANQIVKLSSTLLTNYVGDLVITQAGEFNPAKLFIIHWNGSNFVTRSISYFLSDGSNGRFEHVTFAPLTIPKL